LTPNGKIDRTAFPLAQGLVSDPGAAYVAPRNEQEQKLIEVWERILGVHPIGVEDDFFDLGGHSLLAVRLFSVIEKEIGVTLPLMTLFDSPTIAQQVKYLRGEVSDEETHRVVEIARTGTRPPFFCISPSVIDIITYQDLSRNMGSDQPFYALYSNRLSLWKKGTDHLGDIANELVLKIREISPQGPYLLGGYSAGGHIALAIAQQLIHEGDIVSLVVLFDTFGPNYPMALPWATPQIMRVLKLIRRLESWFWKFRILKWEQKKKYLELPKVQSWLFDRYSETTTSGKGLSGHQNNLESSDRNKSHYQEYAGDALLVRGKKSMLGIYKDRAMGWGSVFTGKFDIRMVPGNHEDILFGPRSLYVANLLNVHISEVLGKRG
ncbi:MAG: hypothetical protein E4G99_09710, partial [Anaerolineales bacterium]